MLREEINALKTGPRELRRFGLLVGGVFALLGGWFWWRGQAYYPWFLAPGAALLLFGLIFPGALRRVYLGWMALALVLGLIVSNVLLILFFFLVVTPIGLLTRCLGKDFLRLKLDPQAKTYWIERDRSAPRQRTDYERQF